MHNRLELHGKISKRMVVLRFAVAVCSVNTVHFVDKKSWSNESKRSHFDHILQTLLLRFGLENTNEKLKKLVYISCFFCDFEPKDVV